MKLQKINKEEYRKKMNLLLVSLVGSLAVFAIAFEPYRSTYSVQGNQSPVNRQGNFHLNVLGDLICCIECIYRESCERHALLQRSALCMGTLNNYIKFIGCLLYSTSKLNKATGDAPTILYFLLQHAKTGIRPRQQHIDDKNSSAIAR
ncbi:DUF3087 domain-containing protein [Vibrio chagasii]|nr:DUF3087 domain-containing protein [Vibrio chagasii]